jgi:hypothetical protein
VERAKTAERRLEQLRGRAPVERLGGAVAGGRHDGPQRAQDLVLGGGGAASRRAGHGGEEEPVALLGVAGLEVRQGCDERPPQPDRGRVGRAGHIAPELRAEQPLPQERGLALLAAA